MDGLDVVDESVEVENEVALILVWMPMMSVMPMVGSTELEGLDPVVRVGVAVVEEWVPVVMVLQEALWPVG